MPRTPIAGIAYSCRAATGADDVGLLEARSGLRAAVELIDRRAELRSSSPVRAELLPVGDVDAIIVELRRGVLGDRIVAEGGCSACGSPIDVEFSLHSFEAHRRPSRPRNVAPSNGDWGWLLKGTELTFRIPAARDVLAAAEDEDPQAALSAGCIAGDLSAGRRRRAEHALATLAPTLSAEVDGQCPECLTTVALWVDARELCLADLRFLAGSVLEEVHLLASTYHWHESDILAMTSARRAAYADCVRATRGAPLPAEAFGG